MIDIVFDKKIKSGEKIYLYLCDSQTMRKMDEDCIAQKDIAFGQLMEDAADALFDYIAASHANLSGMTATVLCGKGNNGGDGRILCRRMLEAAANAFVIDITGDLSENDLSDEKLQEIFSKSDIIIDAVFGTGFRGKLPVHVSRIFRIANGANITAKRIAVDVPSGVNANDGTADTDAFMADETLTFEFIKRGLVSYPGAEYAGKIAVLSIGFPEDTRKLAEHSADKAILLSEEFIKNIFPRRKKNTNKGDFGKLLAICGSENMTGAAYLSAMGALRTGVGLLYLAAPEKIIPVLQTKLNEPVFMPLRFVESEKAATVKMLGENINLYDAVLFGCGVGRGTEVFEILDGAVKNHAKTIIFDADGINALCGNIDILSAINAEKILTPHPGEMARLCGVTPRDIQSDRINIAVDFAKKYKCTLVLKGALTVIAESCGDIYINPTGNPGMAKGGSGDVLTGMIASYAAQGISAAYAACLGVYLHGLAGDIAKSRTSESGMLPSDLTDILPEIQNI